MINVTTDIVQKPALTPEDEQVSMPDKQVMSSEIYKEATQKRDTGKVLFYALKRKFVDERFDVPEEAKQVLYYTLAIGHHLGIVDCLEVAFEATTTEYKKWVNLLDPSTEAHRKMIRYFTFGEITIYPDHIHMLACAFSALDKAKMSTKEQTMTDAFIKVLTAIYHEQTMYMMIRDR
ncbi:formate hydrogenlyase maturation protein HycH [Psychromonas sp. CNPT3]|uniref:formate hydrogenlyase maturation HycH family protein n=1 Tax=Psychromonas sp. CNPT3 TaxID=314282 RepID=UPI0002C0E2EA|nr:formate hydrogenlyase maturation HycH family protein [Psychromonas sp. CNPT3]AGH82384.1 formate hydrogenlyase maturation protein HycH [Psychromonas sp. CNPT3]